MLNPHRADDSVQPARWFASVLVVGSILPWRPDRLEHPFYVADTSRPGDAVLSAVAAFRVEVARPSRVDANLVNPVATVVSFDFILPQTTILSLAGPVFVVRPEVRMQPLQNHSWCTRHGK